MVRSERRRGMPLTGWSFAPSFACASRVFGVRASVGSDRGATRRIRKVAAFGCQCRVDSSAVVDSDGACCLGDGPDAFRVPEPEKGGDCDSFAVGYCGAEDFCDSE